VNKQLKRLKIKNNGNVVNVGTFGTKTKNLKILN
jgi:hypothetical protein